LTPEQALPSVPATWIGKELHVRKLLLTLAGTGLVAAIIVPATAKAAAADDRHCYTLGDYENCTYLPIDPGDLIH